MCPVINQCQHCGAPDGHGTGRTDEEYCPLRHLRDSGDEGLRHCACGLRCGGRSDNCTMVSVITAAVGTPERDALTASLGLHGPAYRRACRDRDRRHTLVADEAQQPIPPASDVVWNTEAADWAVMGIATGGSRFGFSVEHFSEKQVRAHGTRSVRLRRAAVRDVELQETKRRHEGRQHVRDRCVPSTFRMDTKDEAKLDCVAAACGAPHVLRGYAQITDFASDGGMTLQVQSSVFGLALPDDTDFSSLSTVRIVAKAVPNTGRAVLKLQVELQDSAQVSTALRQIVTVGREPTTFDLDFGPHTGSPFNRRSVRNLVMQSNPKGLSTARGKALWTGTITFYTIDRYNNTGAEESLLNLPGTSWWPQPSRTDLILKVGDILEALSVQCRGAVRSAIGLALRQPDSEFGAHASSALAGSVRALLAPVLTMLVTMQLSATSHESRSVRRAHRAELRARLRDTTLLDAMGVENLDFLFPSDVDLLNSRIRTAAPEFGTGQIGDGGLLRVDKNTHTGQPVVRTAHCRHIASTFCGRALCIRNLGQTRNWLTRSR